MKFLHSIQINNLLSFGPEAPTVELGALNVLIGANGSGKSNLIEAMNLVRSTAIPEGVASAVRSGGGVGEWLWKGSATPKKEMSLTLSASYGEGRLDHRFSIGHDLGSIVMDYVVSETIRHEPSGVEVFNKNAEILLGTAWREDGQVRESEEMPVQLLLDGDSVLLQVRNPSRYPEITYLASQYPRIAVYRNWDFRTVSRIREPQRPDEPGLFLSEGGENLALVLNSLEDTPSVRDKIVAELREFSEGFENFSVITRGGTSTLYLREQGLRTQVSAMRLSDGTLRYLCLLAILCHPSPPPLICIEEPETSLHPDILPSLARLLLEASERTQLIVTTHSPGLIDALSDQPECVLVCEKEEGSSVLRRLGGERLRVWLKEYASLGRLWREGEIGGNRW